MRRIIVTGVIAVTLTCGWYLARAHSPTTVTLSDGRLIQILSLTVHSDGRSSDRLNLQYLSGISPDSLEQLEREASEVLGLAAAKGSYDRYLGATVMPRWTDEKAPLPVREGPAFEFLRGRGARWFRLWISLSLAASPPNPQMQLTGRSGPELHRLATLLVAKQWKC